MLLRIACARCHLDSLWTVEPRWFLSTVCRDPRRCEAKLLDEEFRGGSLPPLRGVLPTDVEPREAVPLTLEGRIRRLAAMARKPRAAVA